MKMSASARPSPEGEGGKWFTSERGETKKELEEGPM